MGHLVNIFLALAVVCLIGSSEGRHVRRAEAVYKLPEEYDRYYSESAVSDVMDIGSTVETFSLSPCDESDASCQESASEGVSENYFGGDSSSSMPF